MAPNKNPKKPTDSGRPDVPGASPEAANRVRATGGGLRGMGGSPGFGANAQAAQPQAQQPQQPGGGGAPETGAEEPRPDRAGG